MKLPDNLKFSSKHVQVDQSYARIVVAISFAAAIAIFSLVAAGTLVNKIQYQNKVIGLRSEAADKLKSNVEAMGTLVAAYEAFDSPTESAMGTPEKNSKLALDALPSKYDFPALTTSLYYLMLESGNTVKLIGGTDEELLAEQSSTAPTAKEMAFSFSAAGSYDSTKALLLDLERSIRPFKLKTIEIVGNEGGITINVGGITYYQPQKKLEIKEEVVPASSSAATTNKTSSTGASSEDAVASEVEL